MVWETGVQSQVESYQRLKKMVLDASLLNTQQYTVRIKGKVEQSRKRSSALPLYLSVVAIEKGAFESPSTKVANFIYFIQCPKFTCLHTGTFSSSQTTKERFSKMQVFHKFSNLLRTLHTYDKDIFTYTSPFTPLALFFFSIGFI